MQEEISLRETIETIWKGKSIIALTLITAIIISLVLSYFVISPTYQATSSVEVIKDETSQESLNSLTEAAKSDVSINRVINKLNLNPEQYSIEKLRKKISIQLQKDTRVVKVTTSGHNSSVITSIANVIAFELGARIEISDRSQSIVESSKRLEELENQIELASKELEETSKQLEANPEKIITKQTLADEPFLQSIARESISGRTRDIGPLQLESETVNPVYLKLKERIAETTIGMERNITEKKHLEKAITKHEQKINELDEQVNKEGLATIKSQSILSGFNAIFISPAIEPKRPVGPNKVLNLFIAVILGAIVGLVIVFFKKYWKLNDRKVAS